MWGLSDDLESRLGKSKREELERLNIGGVDKSKREELERLNGGFDESKIQELLDTCSRLHQFLECQPVEHFVDSAVCRHIL